jgi:NosR/NirI family nitrous oxide reductase transcriptional regulator
MAAIRRERILGLVAIASMILAWLAGFAYQGDLLSAYLTRALPAAARFELRANEIYAGYDTAGDGGTLVGYVGVGEASGWGGPMRLAVGVDPAGTIAGVAVLEDKETPAYMGDVQSSRFFRTLPGKAAGDAFALGVDVDAVSGATYTARAIANAVRTGSRRVAALELGQEFLQERPPDPSLGVPEVAILLLYAVGLAGYRKAWRFKRQVRWLSLISGMIVLGFLYSAPLTVANLTGLLLGYWPQWQNHLYWYLLVGGGFLVLIANNKTVYCDWFCPFGATQECLGALGGATGWSPGRGRQAFRWLQRGLAWFAIVVALLLRNPGSSSYEVYGALFQLRGSAIQFAVLGIVLILSLFIRRPWCNYLCPIRPATDFVRMMRAWSIEIWSRIWPKDLPWARWTRWAR